MPPKLPQIEPAIPDGMVFIAITLEDPNAPVAIMGFPTKRRLGADAAIVDWPATPENIQQEIQKSAFDSPVSSWRIIRYSEIPKDRTYRDALKDVAGSLMHHLPTAKRIALDHIRYDRIPLLEQLDKDWLRATGQKNQQKADEAERQRQILRDRPQVAEPLLEKATTLEEIDEIVKR